MDRQLLINSTVQKISQLPDNKIMEVNDFIEFLLMKIDDKILSNSIQKLISESKSFKFLSEEEDIYSLNDLKEKY